MSSLVPFYITAFDKGLTKNKKPFLIPDEAFSTLENAYVFRDRVLKREGLEYIGEDANSSRLRRALPLSPVTLSTQAVGLSYTNNDILADPNIDIRTTQPDAQIAPQTLLVSVGALSFKDNDGTGVLSTSVGNSGNINYQTGKLVLTFSAPIGATNVNVSFNYFPALPVMGIPLRDNAALNDEQTIWFDTKYAYVWSGLAFDEFIVGTTWSGTNQDFFWATNYRGANPEDKLFFATNFICTDPNPIRYTDGNTWTNFAPLVTDTDTLYQARIIIPYYGRLLMMNVWEGTTLGGYVGAKNIQNRCRFSQLGDPIAADAWKSNEFGKGGFVDAPTAEAIMSAMFVKNTLVVQFEETTWQLTYVGEYGFPFVWERISSDFGSDATFSSVLFDNHMLSVGDTAIIATNAVGSQRIDLDIPDQVFQVQRINAGAVRVQGVRNYQKELVYWNYPDGQTMASETDTLVFPNKVLVYNYRNSSWGIFRDSITAFGNFRIDPSITWDSTDVTWDDNDVLWDDVDGQEDFPAIVSGNQQGFVHIYANKSPDDGSLVVEDIDLTVTPIVVTSKNHNLQTGEIISFSGLQFVNDFFPPYPILDTNLNGMPFQVTVIDPDNFSIAKWDFDTQNYAEDQSTWDPLPTPSTSGVDLDVSYVGSGVIILYPKLNVQTKDINVFGDKGMQVKLSYIDFLMQPTQSSAFTVLLAINATLGLPPAVIGGVSTANRNVSTNLTSPFYTQASDYAWFRFFATLSAQFFRICMTYDDNLMNTLSTHAQPWTLYGITAYVRPGGKTPFS